MFEILKRLEYDSVLDLFSGTCSVAYEFKRLGKRVVCNDYLKANYYTALALIENDDKKLTEAEVEGILFRREDIDYPTFIQDTFKGIYYKDDENLWLGTTLSNIRRIDNEYQKALAFHALFQSCLIKRPFNLFHRKNLYLRLAKVERTFHNHKTWEKPFPVYFTQFISEANNCVFSNGQNNKALNRDASSIDQTDFDLVYIDPPHISPNGRTTDYQYLYHFLEGMSDYEEWPKMIDYRTKNRRLKHKPNPWHSKRRIEQAMDDIFGRFKESILVVSYRSPGFPSEQRIIELLQRHKKRVEAYHTPSKYVLSNLANYEILLVAT